MATVKRRKDLAVDYNFDGAEAKKTLAEMGFHKPFLKQIDVFAAIAILDTYPSYKDGSMEKECPLAAAYCGDLFDFMERSMDKPELYIGVGNTLTKQLRHFDITMQITKLLYPLIDVGAGVEDRQFWLMDMKNTFMQLGAPKRAEKFYGAFKSREELERLIPFHKYITENNVKINPNGLEQFFVGDDYDPSVPLEWMVAHIQANS